MKNYLYFLFWLIRTWPMRWSFPKYKIMTIEATIDDIVLNKKSICRFGDGEFILMLKERGLPFQDPDSLLSNKLIETIVNRNEKLIVAIPDSLARRKTHKRFVKVHWLMFINNYGGRLSKIIDKNYYYGNSNMTRLYAGMKDKTKSSEYFAKIKTIWNNQDVLIVEGELSRLGVGNDLLDNAKSIKRIISSNKNAFTKYDDIKNNALKYGEGKLILCALGPTATVLSSELCTAGYWALDIGHIDVEYMWMLMGANQRTAIKGRFVNESNNSEGYDLDEKDVIYYRNSIILELT
ncbi:GT-D fold domain-containing glycosyltransferase [Chryseobacterium gotjawalense]|uniref:GT-D fold domain-containing glycosyltransferase n=1 Tax=Chryseobacterium gotjawalense TaxID=3042315 RepID=A0ABY8RCK6_9FLAO|nr:GT-D fold domain-containing glycosyltransferase [Chryseobacterium sp. wdc7]WHF51424.1 GT-D fold domain-containing glycosyltransferase [Chryseobacterium sp. wdc7]